VTTGKPGRPSRTISRRKATSRSFRKWRCNSTCWRYSRESNEWKRWRNWKLRGICSVRVIYVFVFLVTRKNVN
jgi:hypothetical protein